VFIKGRVWVFGDNIDTDIISPGRYLFSPVEEAAQHAFEAINPEFSKKVKPSDIIVAGRNFGCGSSREIAPQVLKYLGIACVLAEDFARIFFRNAIAVGLPALVVKGISGRVVPLDEVRISFDSGEVIVKRTGETLRGIPLHPKMRDFIKAGGIEGILRALARG
jgi:3-isopropylmalate dehydratase small subunit